MKVLREILIAVVLAVVMLLLLGIFYKPHVPIQVIDREVVKRDTIVIVDYRESEPVYIEKRIIVRDTIYVNTSGDTTATEVASVDTTFGDGAELSAFYFLKPRIFTLEYTPAPVEIQTVNVTNTEYVYIDSSVQLWWDTYRWGATSGVVATALLTFLVK